MAFFLNGQNVRLFIFNSIFLPEIHPPIYCILRLINDSFLLVCSSTKKTVSRGSIGLTQGGEGLHVLPMFYPPPPQISPHTHTCWCVGLSAVVSVKV